MEISRSKRYLLSALSGLLLVISFPYTGSIAPLIFVALIPLLFVEAYISKKNYRSIKVFYHAYLTFFIYNIGTTWWIWYASPGGAAMAFICNSLLMALTFYLFHWCKKAIGKKEGYIGLILLWITFEYLHFNWELSWPWLNLGNVFSRMPFLVQWYDFTGILGGTIWILIINLLGLRIVDNVLLKREKWIIQTPLFVLITAFLLIPIGISIYKYFNFEFSTKKIEAVIVQPNIDPYEVKFSTPVDDQLQHIFNVANEQVTPNTRLVLAPETAISSGFFEEDLLMLNFYPVIRQQLTQWKSTNLLIGASTYRFFDTKNSVASRPMRDGPGFIENYNTSILFNSSGQADFVHKSKLVLGVEKIPFLSVFPFLEKLAIDLDGTSGTLGIESSPQIMKTDDFTFAPAVCYESIYGEFIAEQCRKGAQTICIITNDGWWKDTPGYKQHMSFARLRAVENHRSVARSANTGTSALINERGDVVQSTAWWQEDCLKGNLTLNSKRTFYTNFGDYIGRTFSFTSVFFILLAFVRKFKRKHQSA